MKASIKSTGKGKRKERSVWTALSGIVFTGLLLIATAGAAPAMESCGAIVFGGGGAGKVVFNGKRHVAHGIACSECHEGEGLSFALFEKKEGGDTISMRSIEMGRSCGRCHNVSMSNTLICDYCHHK